MPLLNVSTLQEFINRGIATAVNEPEHSKSIIQQYKDKYKITDDDMEDIIYNIQISLLCEED